eukprot:jgi/Mesvir1/6234/Mv00912-RA.1
MENASRRASQIAGHIAPGGLVMNETRSKGASPGYQVAVLGAGGGIGQPLSLLLKSSPLVATLHLYDVVGTEGVAADLSHVNSAPVVRGFTGPAMLEKALTGCDLVVIPAGIPRKPGMTRDDLFNINAGIVRGLCEGIARHCPKAMVAIVSNPVNSTVPIAAEVFKRAGMYDPRRLFGVTTLDVVRANTFVAEVMGVDPAVVDVPVVGGHAGITILPLLSQTTPAFSFTPDEAKALTVRIQNAGTEVVEAKAGKGSATLSMAYAAAHFSNLILRALKGEPGIIACSYVPSQLTELPYFASKVLLGRHGLEQVLPLGLMNETERNGLQAMMPELRDSINKGIQFVLNPPPAK